MTKLLLVAAFLVTACTDEVTPISDSDHTIEVDDALIAGLTADQVDNCSQTVETEGACAVACDPEAVMSFVPPATCVFFVCELEDGSALNVGGCRDVALEPQVMAEPAS